MEQEPKTQTPTPDDGAPHAPVLPERDLVRSASILESLLLASAQPLSFERIGRLLGGLSRQEVAEVVRIVREKYPPHESGIVIEEVAKGLQLRTNPANQEFVRKLFETKPPRFSRPSLETLAVVAYRQPVTRLEIEQIRGVDCAASLKTLMERRLIKVVGKKDVPGRPFLFGTTREFLEVFSLSGLSELPSMRDIEEFLAARAGTPAPARAADPQAFAGFGGQAGAGEELAAGLTEAEQGDVLLAPLGALPEGVSDDVLLDAAARGEADSGEMKPLAPAGKGFSQFALSGEAFSADPAEPLVTGSSALSEASADDEPDRTDE